MGYNGEFWSTIGEILHELEFDSFSCSPQVIVAMLRVCPRLKPLKVGSLGEFRIYCRSLTFRCFPTRRRISNLPAQNSIQKYQTNFMFLSQILNRPECPAEKGYRHLSATTCNLRRVVISCDSTIGMLAYSLRLIPSVASMSLSKFKEPSDFLKRLRSPCGQRRVITEVRLN